MSTMNEKRTSKRVDEIFNAIALNKLDTVQSCFCGLDENESRDLALEMCEVLKELCDYSLELSRGNLSVTPPSQRNRILAGIKSLHSNLKHLVWQINQVSSGDYGQVVDYMGELSEGFNWMTTQLNFRKAKFSYELEHDSLTGLLNRDAFKRKAFQLINNHPEKKGVLLFSDLDNLKYINDTYGHETGDRYIMGAAEMFAAFRKIDALVSRISGDEFAIYIHGFDSAEETRRIISNLLVEHCRKSIITPNGVKQKIRSSIGMAWYPEDATTVNELMKYADYAMYEAKKSNKGSIMEFNKSVHLAQSNLISKSESINQLIDERLVQFAFQPIVDLSDGSTYGYEALMRSKLKEFSSPIEILAVAASQSKLYQIEQMTFELVLDWMAKNGAKVLEKKIFINSIAGYFLSGKDITAIKTDFPDLVKNIVIELLEGISDDENAFIKKTTAMRRDLGLQIAIDDYGSGHSNEFRLLGLNPDIVKIDRSFICDLHLSHDKQTLLSNVLSFCQSKDIKVLAEGVETPEELRCVVQLGFDFAQGYYFARPNFDPKAIEPEKLDFLQQLNDQQGSRIRETGLRGAR